ncbi:MAG: glycosyltransferase [Polyangiaceae bacterium]|nr:glycosyltransferase [Polyangiaceae bacterium]
MRLLVLASYPRTAACTRFRACEYFPHLEAAGIHAELRPFLDEVSFTRFYEPGRMRKALGVMESTLRRLRVLVEHGRFDGVFVQRESGLIGPAWLETVLVRGLGLPLVFDLDDAVWLDASRTSAHPLATRLLKSPGKTDSLIRMARCVIAGNGHLGDHANALGARVLVLPTVVSSQQWTPLPGRLDGELVDPAAIPTIGWVGTHSTAAQLDMVVPALRMLAERGRKFRVRLVGANRTLDVPGVEVESVDWQLDQEVDNFRRIDIGLAPMFDNEWSRGKCAFKQVQYMSVGVPMVSSRSGAAAELLVAEQNALVADKEHDWGRQIERLLTRRELRRSLARAGRELVETSLCIERQAPVFVGAIREALRATRGR